MKAFRSTLTWVLKHRWLSLVTFLVLVCTGSYFFLMRTRSAGSLSEPITRGLIAETVYGIGTVIANQTFQIRPGQIAHVDRYFCKAGDIVKRGDQLLTLDGITMRAPFAGSITSLPFKTGENVYTQAAILTLTDLSDRYMTVSLEQQGALRVLPGQKVRMSFDSIREKSYGGVVRSLYSNGLDFLAQIDVGALPKRILPGMTADVAIIISVRDNALLIPVAAVNDGHLWVKHKSGLTEYIPIKLGVIDKDVAELVEGNLSEGDRAIIKGVTKK